MTGMTPERIEEIRKRKNKGLTQGIYGERSQLLAHVDYLTAENARLRAGIEDIKAKALDRRKIITEGPLVGRLLVSHWCDNALLNPTEGETDGR